MPASSAYEVSQDLARVAVPLRPAQVHPLELLGEVRGVHAAGLGADVDQRLTGVVLAGQEGTDLHLVDRLAHGEQFGLRLGEGVGVVLRLGQLEEHFEVVDPAAQGLGLAQLALEVGQPAGDLLGVVRVVPQRGDHGLLLEPGDVGPHLVQVEDRLDGLHGGGEGLQLFGCVEDCHRPQPTGPLRGFRLHRGCGLSRRVAPRGFPSDGVDAGLSPTRPPVAPVGTSPARSAGSGVRPIPSAG